MITTPLASVKGEYCRPSRNKKSFYKTFLRHPERWQNSENSCDYEKLSFLVNLHYLWSSSVGGNKNQNDPSRQSSSLVEDALSFWLISVACTVSKLLGNASKNSVAIESGCSLGNFRDLKLNFRNFCS